MCKGIEGGPACVRACPTGAAIRVSPTRSWRAIARPAMIAQPIEPRPPGPRRATPTHESFLVHRRFRYLKLALVLTLASVVAYLAWQPPMGHSGGTGSATRWARSGRS